MKSRIILCTCISILLIGLTSCYRTKTIQSMTGGTVVTTPFKGKEFKSNKEYFRIVTSGHSPNLEDARTTAYTNAYGILGGNIKTILSRAIKQATSRLDIGSQQDFEGRLRSRTWVFIDEVIKSSTLIDDKLIIEPDKSYTYWIAIELPTKTILDGTKDIISKDKKMEQSIGEKEFSEEIEIAKSQMENERNSNEK